MKKLKATIMVFTMVFKILKCIHPVECFYEVYKINFSLTLTLTRNSVPLSLKSHCSSIIKIFQRSILSAQNKYSTNYKTYIYRPQGLLNLAEKRSCGFPVTG